MPADEEDENSFLIGVLHLRLEISQLTGLGDCYSDSGNMNLSLPRLFQHSQQGQLGAGAERLFHFDSRLEVIQTVAEFL